MINRTVTRYSGRYTPGFYLKTKIIPTVMPSKRKNSKKITNIPGLTHFKNELQCLILKNLKAKGCSLRSGIFVISLEMEYFFFKKYFISKRWQTSQNILKELEITAKVYRSESPEAAIEVSEFEFKLGNSRRVKYHVKVRIIFLFG